MRLPDLLAAAWYAPRLTAVSVLLLPLALLSACWSRRGVDCIASVCFRASALAFRSWWSAT
jgi:hypothetical protein